MSTQSIVTKIALDALVSLNMELPEDKQVPVAEDTNLFGNEAVLDSLSLVSVIVDVEGGVSDAFSKNVALTDDEAMSQTVSPFTNVKTLVAYIVAKLEES